MYSEHESCCLAASVWKNNRLKEEGKGEGNIKIKKGGKRGEGEGRGKGKTLADSEYLTRTIGQRIILCMLLPTC